MYVCVCVSVWIFLVEWINIWVFETLWENCNWVDVCLHLRLCYCTYQKITTAKFQIWAQFHKYHNRLISRRRWRTRICLSVSWEPMARWCSGVQSEKVGISSSQMFSIACCSAVWHKWPMCFAITPLLYPCNSLWYLQACCWRLTLSLGSCCD